MNSIRSTLIVYLRKFLRLIYAFRLRRYPTLRALLERFSRSKSAAVDLADAIALYEYVLTRKPKCILELGSGTSTNIICQAIADVQKCDSKYVPKFLSYEENPEWLRFHEETFVPELRSYVEFGALETSVKKLETGGGAAHYVGLPVLPYDFVFVDGPDFLRHGCEWSCDVLDLADTLAKKVLIVFDSREHTVRQVWARLKAKNFRLERHKFSLCYELKRD